MILRTALFGILVVACQADDLAPPDDGSLGGSMPATSSSTGTATPCELLLTECAFGQFCDTQPGSCGGRGVCTNAPSFCQGECVGTCGCDGAYYCNACLAWQAGVDVDSGASCAPPPPSYGAFDVGGDPTRLVLFKSDVARDICIRIVLVAEDADPAFDVRISAPWSIASALATDHALDCRIGPSGEPVPLEGASVQPTAAVGTIDIDGPSVPCGVSANLTLELPATNWIGPTESFELPHTTLVLCE